MRGQKTAHVPSLYRNLARAVRLNASLQINMSPYGGALLIEWIASDLITCSCIAIYVKAPEQR